MVFTLHGTLSRHQSRDLSPAEGNEISHGSFLRGSCCLFLMRKLNLLLLFLVLLVGCAKYDYNSFYNEIKILDQKYGGDFRNEMLNGTMVAFDNLSLMRDELIELREDLVKKGVYKTKSAILLIDVRLNMLESQKFWYSAKNLGDKGIVTDGFSCRELPEILLSRSYYNESLSYGLKAITTMDSMLIYYPESRELFGVDKDKIKFYYSPFGVITFIIEENSYAMKKFCGYKFS